ncbi:16S rRNA (uracil(1498)-N(3))-methyltransferase [Lentibacillus sediminis]|uniref:16S rRNA (uracil(1498)-N(3))-methyltransferase n=1 Tax=Lentibacillus sediminis TaxID=1940529 RepID=UPI000C1BE0D0|nr:16S rRNA (uracil(1498)-N(3))-methyltransferase [Lentibacillus sediminis]
MQRYFIPEENWNASEVHITGDDAHHIKRVMRFQTGDKIICNRPSGEAATCRISDLAENEVRATIEEWLAESAELPIEVCIAQGLPKGDKFELILQKGTELGASAFIPFQAERSIAKWDEKKAEKKLNRFAKIVKEASEQSHRSRIPQIHKPLSLQELMEETQKWDKKIFAFEEEAKTANHQSFGSMLNQTGPGERVLVCIGPEGGFSPKEAEQLTQNGFQPVRFGPRILRTETAALYALASISYHFEELRC